MFIVKIYEANVIPHSIRERKMHAVAATLPPQARFKIRVRGGCRRWDLDKAD